MAMQSGAMAPALAIVKDEDAIQYSLSTIARRSSPDDMSAWTCQQNDKSKVGWVLLRPLHFKLF